MCCKSYFFVVFLSFCFGANAQVGSLNDVPKAFENVSNKPSSKFRLSVNAFQIPKGGHLQGIQSFLKNDVRYVIVTASSTKYSYYFVSNNGRTANLQEILPTPFNHAGACQAVDDKLFVGVEDNRAKNKSVVAEISVDSSQQQIVVNRAGVYKRSTAGAVGATKMDSSILVAVADWDSRNIDFYLSRSGNFDSVATCNTATITKGCFYQSINLIADTSGRVYMLGFCRYMGKDRADLFEVKNYELQHLATRYFLCGVGYSFRYAVGIELFDSNTLFIYVTKRNVKGSIAVHVH